MADPFSLERARAIEAKAAMPLLAATLRVGAWAPTRRRARGRLRGLVATFGQYRELGDGMGGIVLDPTGELTENILFRVPASANKTSTCSISETSPTHPR